MLLLLLLLLLLLIAECAAQMHAAAWLWRLSSGGRATSEAPAFGCRPPPAGVARL